MKKKTQKCEKMEKNLLTFYLFTISPHSKIVGPAHNQCRKKLKPKFYKQRNILKLNETWKRII